MLNCDRCSSKSISGTTRAPKIHAPFLVEGACEHDPDDRHEVSRR